MKRFALIGYPIAGSLSPALFAAAYGGRYPYDLLEFPLFADAWKAFLDGYDGINVTAPFKQDAFAAVDSLSPEARRCGAVNLVVRSSGGLTGYNTDVDGVIGALSQQEAPEAFQGMDALVVGTGGAARAAIVAAQKLGCSVTVAGRSAQKVSALAREMGCEGLPLSAIAGLRPGLLLYTLPGDAPVPEGLPTAGALVLEAEYKHPALREVPCRRYIGGKSWLLFQALAGYRLFTGEVPSLDKTAEVL